MSAHRAATRASSERKETMRHTRMTLAALLAGAALLALGTAPAAAQTKPNILIIWGDDIGQFNVSAYNLGVMGYRTPNIDRIAREGALFTDWYGQQSCTAGRAAFITGPVAHPHRPHQGRPARRARGHAEGGPDDRRAAQDPGLHDRPVRQEPPRRPRRDAARRTHGFDEFFGNLYHLNAEEEPENVDYPKDPEFRKRSARAACIQLPSAGRTRDRGHRPADQQAHGDRGRGDHRRGPRLHGRGASRRASPSSSGGTPPACTSSRTSSRNRRARPASASTPTAWSSTTAWSAQLLDKLKELGLDEQHHRHVLHRQRRGGDQLARRRHHAVPRREEHQLGGRLPRAVRDPLARRHQARHGDQRHLLARRHDADARWPRPASPTSRRSCSRA